MLNQNTIGICALKADVSSYQIMPENHVGPENQFELEKKTVDDLIVEKQA